MDPPRELGMGGKRRLAQARAGLDRVHLRAQCLQARSVAAAARAGGCFVALCGRAPPEGERIAALRQAARRPSVGSGCCGLRFASVQRTALRAPSTSLTLR